MRIMMINIGYFMVIPATLLLAISFFVLFAMKKIETAGLRNFGLIVAVLLWISAAILFVAGLAVVSTGRYPMMGHMQGWGMRGGYGMQGGYGAKGGYGMMGRPGPYMLQEEQEEQTEQGRGPAATPVPKGR